MIGCYRLPIAYAIEDLRMGSERVSKGFRNLCGKGFVTHDSGLSWVLINKFLKWNPIENPNQGIAASKLVMEVPRNSSVYAPLIEILRVNSRNFPEASLRVWEPFRNRFETRNRNRNRNRSRNRSRSRTSPSTAIQPNLQLQQRVTRRRLQGCCPSPSKVDLRGHSPGRRLVG